MSKHFWCAYFLAIKLHKLFRYEIFSMDDGYFGPKELKQMDEYFARWPHVIFFRACLAMYEYNKDKKIDAITRHYLEAPVNHFSGRNALNIEIMAEVYKINKNKGLLNMAIKTYAGAEIEKLLNVTDDEIKPSEEHGVTYNEFAKLGVILYECTGDEKYLLCSIRAFKKLETLYSLPGGCVSSSVLLHNNRYDETYET